MVPLLRWSWYEPLEINSQNPTVHKKSNLYAVLRVPVLLHVGNQTCKNLKLDAEFPIYVQAQQPEDRLESVRLFPFYSIQNLHVWFFTRSTSWLDKEKNPTLVRGWKDPSPVIVFLQHWGSIRTGWSWYCSPNCHVVLNCISRNIARPCGPCSTFKGIL